MFNLHMHKRYTALTIIINIRGMGIFDLHKLRISPTASALKQVEHAHKILTFSHFVMFTAAELHEF